MDVASPGTSEDRPRALVRVACGRIAGCASAILEAHELGVAEGVALLVTSPPVQARVH